MNEEQVLRVTELPDWESYVTTGTREKLQVPIHKIINEYNEKIASTSKDGVEESVWERRVTVTVFVHVGCHIYDLKDTGAALHRMAGALEKLHAQGWIHGHLMLPSIIEIVVDPTRQMNRLKATGSVVAGKGWCVFAMVHIPMVKADEAVKLDPCIVQNETVRLPFLEDLT